MKSVVLSVLAGWILCLGLSRQAEGSLKEKANQLIALASSELGELTRGETLMFGYAAYGRPVDYHDLGGTWDFSELESWGPERTIRAEALTWICTNEEGRKLLSHHGVSLTGAKIVGKVDLQFARLSFPLELLSCSIPDGMSLQNAELRELSLSGSQTGAIHADGMHVERDLIFTYEFTATGEVRLAGSEIGGDLDCSGGLFLNSGPDALYADGISVRGDVFLRYDFQATGRVSLRGARIQGNLDCEGGQFQNPGLDALFASGVQVEGDLLLRDDFAARGTVNFHGARVGGQWDCNHARFENPGKKAIDAEGLVASSDVYFRDGFVAEGQVILVGAKITGNFDCDGAQFLNNEDIALSAKRLHVSGDLFLGNGTADSFRGQGMLILESAKIEGTFSWVGMQQPDETSLNLRFASLGRLWFEPDGWPGPDCLSLHGLVYEVFYNHKDADVKRLIDWVRRQPSERFRPQPYEQLAAVLRKSGHEEEADQILIAKEEDRSTEMSSSGRLLHRLLGLTIAYGYDPWRALWIGLVIVLLGAVVFALGSRAGLIAATKEVEHVIDNPDAEIRLSRDYPRFNPLIYSLDMFVPLLDLHQANYWLPSAERGRPFFKAGRLRFNSGSTLRLYLGIHIYLGWALTTLLAVGLSGLVQS